MKRFFSKLKITAAIGCLALSGCSSVGNVLNPFAQTDEEIPKLGNRDDSALNESQDKGEKARAALEAMATYQAALPPQPVNPVMRPAVVRLMWIPDHLNKNGDLVPAHYYYLKVKSDQWALQDAFELEQQLGPKSDSSNVPYVYEGKR